MCRKGRVVFDVVMQKIIGDFVVTTVIMIVMVTVTSAFPPKKTVWQSARIDRNSALRRRLVNNIPHYALYYGTTLYPIIFGASTYLALEPFSATLGWPLQAIFGLAAILFAAFHVCVYTNKTLRQVYFGR